MVKIITDGQEIERLHKKFHRQLSRQFNEKIKCWVGYPGGANEDTVKYSRELNIWLSVQELETRFWNGLGIGEPIEGKNNSLSGEINFPYKDIDRRIAGAFAKDDKGKTLILHRGRIGGGKEGIGKHSLIENFRGDFITAIDDNKDTEFCFVGELDSPHLAKQVSNFIYEIKRIKDLIATGQDAPFSSLNNFSFTDEKSGTSKKTTEQEREIERTHGLIVNALAGELTNRNLKIGNDLNRDLFIHNGKDIITLFEVKTNSATQNIYSAVGQLLIYSIPIKTKVKLVFVTQEKLNDEVEERLKNLGIDVMYFNWDNERINFNELDNVLG
jgi:hypothetical protein